MSIALETSKGTSIRNHQDSEISAFQRNWNARLPKMFPNARPRTQESPMYNCHGLTFACRRTRIEDTPDVHQILSDDDWRPVEIEHVLPGDVVLYLSEDGDANHSGVVVTLEEPFHLPIICSKWGNAGEYIHRLRDCPTMYGPVTKFYRCSL